MLDTLLLVFIVVELLFAVRVILGRREVVAEPFLIVGIIASIKEIIVLSVEAADYVGKDDKFTHAIIEVGVLGALVLVLAVAAILLRAKEKEPREGDRVARAEARKDGEAVTVAQGDPTGGRADRARPPRPSPPARRSAARSRSPAAGDVAHRQDAGHLARVEDHQVPEAPADHRVGGLLEGPGRRGVDQVGRDVVADPLGVGVLTGADRRRARRAR